MTNHRKISREEALAKLNSIQHEELTIYSEFFGADLVFKQPDANAGLTLQHMFISLQDSDVISQEKIDMHNRKLKAYEARRKKALETGAEFNQAPPTIEGVEESGATKINIADIAVSLIIACSHEPRFEEEDRALLMKMTFAQVMEIGSPLMSFSGFSGNTAKDDEATFQEESPSKVLPPASSGDGDDSSGVADEDVLPGTPDASE